MVSSGEPDPIADAWRAGRDAWPGVELDLDAFARHVAAIGRDGHDGLAAAHVADLYLAAACLAGDRTALACFERDILGAARAAIAAIDSAAAFVDEALATLTASLVVGDRGAPKLAQYAGRGPLRAWVGVAAARAALMLRRTQKRAKETPIGDDDWSGALAMLPVGNPELDLLKRQYAAAFQTALRDAVAALPARERAALRMSFVDALSIDEIGAVYAVHRATAARWVQRACDSVFDETRRLLTERLALSATELDRMTAMVRSQLDVSLSQLLPAAIT